MDGDSADLSSQLRQRLLVLIAQVERDRAALKVQQSGGISADILGEGDRVYGRLLDSLHATLHNLDRSQAAEKHLT